MKKRVIFVLVCFLFALLCSLAILCPNLTAKKFMPKKDDLIKSYSKDEIRFNGCAADQEGIITLTGSEAAPNFEIDGINTEGFETVALYYAAPLDSAVYTRLSYSKDGSYNNDNSILASSLPGDDHICFVIPKDRYSSLCIETVNIASIRSVEIHQEQPDAVYSDIPVSPVRYGAAVFIALLFAVAAWILDRYFKIAEIISDFFAKRWKTILKGLAVIIAAVFLSMGIEALIGKVILHSGFNGQRAAFIWGIISCIALLVLCRKTARQKIENIVLCLMLIIGTVMIIVSPFSHICWDNESHYRYSMNASNIGTTYMSEADMEILNLAGFLYSPGAAENSARIDRMNGEDYVVSAMRQGFSTVAHIPLGVAMAVTRFVGFDFYTRYNLTRFAPLLIYALLIYFAIKKLKSGKMILAVIALFPTNLFIVTNYTYDYWVTGFALLGMAYFIGECQRYTEEISTLDTVIMCGAFALACLPKLIYAPLLIIPFFMRKQEFTGRRKYYLICAAVLALAFMLLSAQSFLTVSGSGDVRGGSDVSPMLQIQYIFSHPVEYLKLLFNFMLQTLSLPAMNNYISNFAYLGVDNILHIFTILLIVTACTDKNECDVNISTPLLRIAGIVFFFGMAALIATCFYIDYTPVGLDQILGCQSRYFLPVLYPFAALIGSGKIKNNLSTVVYDYGVLGAAAVTLFIEMYVYFLSPIL